MLPELVWVTVVLFGVPWVGQYVAFAASLSLQHSQNLLVVSKDRRKDGWVLASDTVATLDGM